MPNKYTQRVLDEHLAHLDYFQTRIQSLDRQIEQIAASELYAPAVKTQGLQRYWHLVGHNDFEP